MKKFFAIILAITLSVVMLTGCGNDTEEKLSTPKENTIGSWKLTTDQEDTFEKLTLLTGAEGTYYQFNCKKGTLAINAAHYVNGKKTESGDIANFVVSGDGYLYIDYADSDKVDFLNEMLDEEEVEESNEGTVRVSVTSDEGQDGTNLQFETSGSGSSDTQMSIQNTDDSWKSSDDVPITYGKAMDIWAINLGGGGDIEDTISATKKAWKKKECVIITATFTEDENASAGDSSEDESDDSTKTGVDESDSNYDNLSEEDIKEIEKEFDEADTEG